MSMIMNHDMTAIMGHRIMQRNSLAMKRSLEKLSSGLRTKIADVDNTAGLAISETMRSRIGGMEKALNNSQDGISMIQTASGALDQTQSMLMRMRELTVQAKDDALTQQDRSYIQVEINEIRDEISSLAANTQFNRKNILSGDSAVLWSSTDSKVSAIVNGGIRSIDNYGQKYAVDGNYRINVRTDAGKAQVQKTDIFKIKHDDTAENKMLNERAGVSDVSVSGVQAGHYSITLADDAEMATEGLLTSSYGIGGNVKSSDTEITFAEEIGAPVTKITVSTTDGIDIWSTAGSDLFKFTKSGGVTTAADQSAFFEGRNDTSNGQQFIGVKDEIIAAAQKRGITLSGFEDADSESGALNLNARVINGSAPGIKITYETSASGVAPMSAITVNDAEAAAASEVFNVEVSDANVDNASVLFEVTSLDVDSNTVVLKATANKLSQDGESSTVTQDNIILTMGADGDTPNTASLHKLFGGTEDDPAVSISLGESGVNAITSQGRFVYSIRAGSEDASNNNVMQLDIGHVPESSNRSSAVKSAGYILNGASTANSELKFREFFISDSGQVSQGSITLTTSDAFRTVDAGGKLDPESTKFLASFDAGYSGQIANGSTKLRDIDKFWTGEGEYILEQPKELTLTQGDGKQATITIYGEDTIDDLTRKLNDAIGNGLGQSKYVDAAGKFASFVEGDTPGFEAAEGTIVIRSVLAGNRGEISISGNEEILNAFSLNTIQASEETKYDVTVRDAHDDSVIAQNVKITGNVLVGVVHKNVDVEFDPMLGITASWNDSINNFVLDDTAKNNGTDVILHLADNTTIFQVGGSEGEDVMVSIGDMSSHALGLDGVNVMSRAKASESISMIDSAIDKVSMQQAKLGAALNRLEHHIGNLTDETEALVAANSRIRDVDYMSEIMEFTKQNILMNSNTAMLAQANQIQSSTILTLMRI